MDRLSGYIQNHLADYIRKELDHGYSLSSIRKVLLNYHNHDIIDAAIRELEKNGFHMPKKRAGKTKRLDKRLFLETVNMLQDYIIRQKKRGYEIHHIREALHNFGHTRTTVKAAIDAVELGSEPLFVDPFDYAGVRRALFPGALALFCIFVIWLAASVDENLVKVTVLFFPTLATLFLVRGFFPVLKTKQTVLVFPLFLIVLYYVLGSTGQSLFQGVEVANLSVLNFLFSFVYAFFFVGAAPEVVQSEKEDLKEGFDLDEEVLEAEYGKKKNKLTSEDVDEIIENKIEAEQERLRPVRLEVKEVKS